MADDILSLIRQKINLEELPADFEATVNACFRPVAAMVAAKRAQQDAPLVLGINGAQGSGKSTMAAFLKILLEHEHVLKTAILSIDDFYLGKKERRNLAANIHPLLATRGVPGTHDVSLGLGTIRRLLSAGDGNITPLPRFDKARDDRLPERQWDSFRGSPDIVILEGWCVGARPQPDTDLDEPVNDLERLEDPDGIWRHYVNDQLKGNYRDLFDLIDILVMLRVPSFDCVFDFRLKQEQQLARKRTGQGEDLSGLMSEKEIRRFIMFYERLTRFMLTDLPREADMVLELDEDHRITGFAQE